MHPLSYKNAHLQIMISIIVCSRYPSLSDSLSSNISQTIGESFETISIDNSNNRLSIFGAYNQGVKQAKGDILMFMHDDIVFRTQNWGQVIAKSLEDMQTGVVGVLGGHIIDETSVSWTSSGFYSGQVIQVANGTTTTYNHNEAGLGNTVIALDGMLLAMRKELFDKETLKWDSSTYNGFHFYDLDICMQAVSQGYQVKAVPILLEHRSLGAFNQSFYDSCRAFHQKWDNILPVHSSAITPEMQKKAYQKALDKICAQGRTLASYNRLMNKFPYKIATKLLLLFGIDPYK